MNSRQVIVPLSRRGHCHFVYGAFVIECLGVCDFSLHHHGVCHGICCGVDHLILLPFGSGGGALRVRRLPCSWLHSVEPFRTRGWEEGGRVGAVTPPTLAISICFAFDLLVVWSLVSVAWLSGLCSVTLCCRLEFLCVACCRVPSVYMFVHNLHRFFDHHVPRSHHALQCRGTEKFLSLSRWSPRFFMGQRDAQHGKQHQVLPVPR